MPKFWKRKQKSEGDQSPWFVRNSSRKPQSSFSTFQLRSAAIRILRGMGLESGDSFEEQQLWTLRDLGLTYTLGEDDDSEPSQNLSECSVE